MADSDCAEIWNDGWIRRRIPMTKQKTNLCDNVKRLEWKTTIMTVPVVVHICIERILNILHIWPPRDHHYHVNYLTENINIRHAILIVENMHSCVLQSLKDNDSSTINIDLKKTLNKWNFATIILNICFLCSNRVVQCERRFKHRWFNFEKSRNFENLIKWEQMLAER